VQQCVQQCESTSLAELTVAPVHEELMIPEVLEHADATWRSARTEQDR
jgi:hypothetical protein